MYFCCSVMRPKRSPPGRYSRMTYTISGVSMTLRSETTLEWDEAS
jgi:hypothetical protein